MNDFSWRNRVVAYQGALLIGEKPWLGFGWGKAEAVYSQYYQPIRTSEGNTLTLNSYLYWGATFGAAGLFSLLGYVYLCLSAPPAFGVTPKTIFLRATCQAAALLILAGLWFDGGIFRASLSAPLWLLLELGRQDRGLRSSLGCGYALRSSLGWGYAKRGVVLISWACSAVLVIGALVSVTQVAVSRFIVPSLSDLGRAKIYERRTVEGSPFQYASLEMTSGAFLRAVWVSEDHRFFDHYGFDWAEISNAISQARATGLPMRGASTISQQCARSLFLWQGRSWLRKGIEAYYTILMELMLPKERILELYINAIEFGNGIYGIEAAAQHYYGVSAKDLTREQAAMLVAIMPNPKQWNPLKPNERVIRRFELIMKRSEGVRLPIEAD
jgi:monofunctional biosynthetic peptidoglycan transglycosylase